MERGWKEEGVRIEGEKRMKGGKRDGGSRRRERE